MDVEQVREFCLVARDAYGKGDFQSARQAAVEALRHADLSGSALPHHARAMANVTLALIERATGEASAAAAAMAAALDEARALEPADFENAAVILQAAAQFARAAGDEPQAKRLGAELVEWHARHLGDDHPRYFARKFEWQPPS